MNLAQQALALNNLGRAWELLVRHRPTEESQISNFKFQIQTDLRGWEWRYLWQQCQSDALFTLCQKTNWIWGLAVSHDGRWVAVGEEPSNALSVWDLRSRQEIESLPAGEGYIRAAFSPKEPLLAYSFVTDNASTKTQFRVRLWNGATRKIVGEFTIGGPSND